ncbi:MAG TPA: 8-amino-7-oxononanoate synthase [Candidatus Acidoferrales bacterium]|nr:8-amino-7-oxononanoate synthase [Candidatus Acidoferrales bacterium]
MTNKGIEARIQYELDALARGAQLRTLEEIRGINLCSNDYLALSDDPVLKAATAESVARAAHVSSTGSRLLSGHSAEWARLEAEFAQFAGTEAALFFSSGYAANMGLLSALLKPGDAVFSDALNHASLIDGMRLSGAQKVVYPHGDLKALDAMLGRHGAGTGSRVIVSESTFSMDGDAPAIAELVALARKHGAELILDEAHATGVCGPEGRGRAAAAGCERECLAIVHTCGKALAGMGAFVCSSETVKQYLVNRARSFLFSTALPPYFAAQIRAALEIARAAEDRREHLRAIARELRELLARHAFDTREGESPIVPVIVGDNGAAVGYAEFLQGRGFAVRAIRPPTVPAGTSRLRLSLTARVTRGDVCRLVDSLVDARDALRSEAALAANG